MTEEEEEEEEDAKEGGGRRETSLSHSPWALDMKHWAAD